MATTADRVEVWVDEWQTACCGTPFTVGDAVRWTVTDRIDRSFLARTTSPAVADRVDLREEHHDDRALLELIGVVRDMRLVVCSPELQVGGSGPASEGARLQPVRSTEERPPIPEGAVRSGWIVQIESRDRDRPAASREGGR